MAMHLEGVKKPAMDILLECRDTQDKLITQYALERQFDNVAKDLNDKTIGLYKLKDSYVARPYTVFDDWKAEVIKILNKFTRGYDVISISTAVVLPEKFCKYDIVTFKKENEVIIVGERSVTEMISREFGKREDVSNSWGTIELVDISLTTKEQATLYLHDMWNCSLFEQNGIQTEKKSFYKVALKIHALTEEKLKREIEIKHVIESKKIYETFEKFDAYVIKFVSRPDIADKIDGKINCTFNKSRLKCAWYVDVQKTTVLFYGKSQQDADSSLKEFMNFIVRNSFELPPKFISSEKVNQQVSEMNSHFSKFAYLVLNEQLPRIHYVCTSDKKSTFEIEMKKSLVATKTLQIYKNQEYFKQILEEIREPIQIALMVDIEPIEKIHQYGWVIRGFPEDVLKAYDELCNLVKKNCCKEKSYNLDGTLEMNREMIVQCTQKSSCLAKVEESSWAYKPVNLQQETLYHEWLIPSLNIVRLIHSEQNAWLTSSSYAIKFETSETQESHRGGYTEEVAFATVYIPRWMNGRNKEKETLSSTLAIFLTKSRFTKYENQPLVLNLRSTSEWPWEQYLKILLVTLNSHRVLSPIYICEPKRTIFEEASSIIQTFIEQSSRHSGIEIKVIIGELVKQKTAAVVNSTTENLTLSNGALSSSILKSAGKEIQAECDKIMEARTKKRPLLPDEVVATSAGNMVPCKYVFHGALASWDKQQLSKFVHNCLHEADQRGVTSLAFPSLGTGNLKYPPEDVARIMFETIQKYGLQRQKKVLRDVLLVIYDKDYKSVSAFNRVYEIYKTGCPKTENYVKCPNPLKIKVTLTGKDEQAVELAFVSLEKSLKQADPLYEPTIQSIDRNDTHDNHDSLVDEEEKRLMEWASPGGDKYEVPVSKEKPSLSDVDNETCGQFIKFVIKEDNGRIYETLVKSLKKYSIEEKYLVWSPLIPFEARIKLGDDIDRNKVFKMLEEETKYELQECDADAVINIRATVNDRVSSFLKDNKKKIADLKEQSGVDVVIGESTVVLTGDLYSITAAREIICQWITKEPRVVGVDSRESSATNVLNSDDSHFNTEKESAHKPMDSTSDYNDGRTSQLEKKSSNYCQNSSSQIISNETNNEIGGVRPKELLVSQQKPKALSRVPSDDSKVASHMSVSEDDDEEEGDVYDENDEDWHIEGTVTRSKFPKLENSFMIYTHESISVYIYQGHLCYVHADCIVNSTNEYMNSNSGLSKVVMEEGGPLIKRKCEDYIEKKKKLEQGRICITPSGNLVHYKCIIHACVPVWAELASIGSFEKKIMEVIESALVMADDQKLTSVAFPAMGSGGRGAPKQVCFKAFAKAVQAYSRNYKNSTVKQIHFVDRDAEIVDFLKAAFVHVLQEAGEKRESMLNKIPMMITETFDFTAGSAERDIQPGDSTRLTLQNNVKLVVCDGALLSAPKHKHSHLTDGFKDAGICLPVAKNMKKDGCSMALCRQRCTDDFHRSYDFLHGSKKKEGDIIEMCHDKNIKFSRIVCVVMPTLTKIAKKEHTGGGKFLTSFQSCCSAVLDDADKSGVKHIALPVLATDIYQQAEDMFQSHFIGTMFDAVNTFACYRKSTRPLTVHVATNGREKYKHCRVVLFNRKWYSSKETSGKQQ